MSNRLAPFLWAALAAFAVGCGKAEPAPASEDHEEHAAHASQPKGTIELEPRLAKDAGIVVQAVEASSLQGEIVVPALVGVLPEGRAVVTPPVAGRVVRLLVRVGDAVREGQPLATLESVELAERASAATEAGRGRQSAEAEVARAEAELRLASARRTTAEETRGRQTELARSGAFSQPSLQAAERALSDAQAALESAQREAVVHQAQLERSERLYRQELVSRIELENARLDVEKDRIAQERATREIGIARVAYERERRIGRQGLLNARELQTAEAEVRAARLEAERARIAVRAARAAVVGAGSAVADASAAYAALKGVGNRSTGGRLTLVAPMAGRVVHREASVGQAVERTAELFEIDDVAEVFVTAQIPERDVERVRPGAEVAVTVAAYPGRTFAGRVETLGGRLDPKTRTLPALCRVPNPGGALRPEMFAQATIRTGPRAGVPGAGVSGAATPSVPEAALYEEGGKRFAFVEVRPGAYARREVVVGRRQGGRIEIVRGVRAGERIVVDGVFTLRSQAAKDELKGHED